MSVTDSDHEANTGVVSVGVALDQDVCRTRLGDKGNEVAKNLSHGHQRALEVAIALAANPELLMLDEPVAGMSVQETQEMIKIIRRTLDRGITVLLVEHDMKMVMDICTRICVINFGKKLAEGLPQQIRTNPEVITAYLGSEYTA